MHNESGDSDEGDPDDELRDSVRRRAQRPILALRGNLSRWITLALRAHYNSF